MGTLGDGRALADARNPGVEAALDAGYGRLPPGVAEAVVDFAWGRACARPGLDVRTRFRITSGALPAQGAQTRRPLTVNVAAAGRAAAGREEIAATNWRMAHYGGLPAAISGLNAALEVFADENRRAEAANGRTWRHEDMRT